jgi:WD40 repeat protein
MRGPVFMSRQPAWALVLAALLALPPAGALALPQLLQAGLDGALPPVAEKAVIAGVDTGDLSWADNVAASPDGQFVYLTGRILGVGAAELNASKALTSGYDIKTVAYEAATGRPVWTAFYNGPGKSVDRAVHVSVSPDSQRIFVTGFSTIAVTGKYLRTDLLTLAFDAKTGAYEWEARYHGPRPNAPWAVGQKSVVSADGQRVFVGGLTFPPGLAVNMIAFNFTTLAYDAETGRQEWVNWYNGTGNVEDWGYDLALSPDGRHVLTTGRSYGGVAPIWDYATVSYDSETGREEWVSRFDGGAKQPVALPYVVSLGDWSSSLGVSPDGQRVYVTGRMQTDDSNYDYGTVAYDTWLGEPLWVARYDGPGHQEDGAYALGVSPDGSRVFVTGWSASADPDLNFDYATVAYDAMSGEQLWASRYAGSHGTFDDAALSLQVAPDGSRVYVAGWSYDDTVLGYSYAVVTYDAASGKEVWVQRELSRPANNIDVAARFNAAGDDTDMVTLDLSPDGRTLYMAGTDPNITFLGVAYDSATGAIRWSTAGGNASAPVQVHAAGSADVTDAGAAGPRDARAPGAPEAVGLMGVALAALAARRRRS